MGKKSGRSSSGADAPKATAFVLKVATHCRCDGCVGKIRDAVKNLTIRCEGIQSLDQSALDTRGELALVATADPEKLRRRLRKATGKSVDLVFPKPAARPAAPDGGSGREEENAAVQAQALLLAGLQQQHGRPWYALQQGGYGPPPETYLASYPAAAWGAYPHNGLDGANGGGWFGY